ncbi:NEAT domain-containing protein [Paenibacillus sp. TAB 01]|uniref:NEAT domain-containing protein n=1 Tax=Paenibacillus sp. TAB 01 TaxID=3368988 RepID=UPI0037511315
MNRQFKKSVSAVVMFFMLLTLIVPFQAAFAASTPVTGFNYSTGTTQAVYGAPYGVNLVVSDVTDTVYQQVYAHEAIINYDSSVLEVSQVVNTDASYFNDPIVTELAPGQTKLLYQATSPANPYLLTNAAQVLSQVVFTPKVNPASSTSTTISMTNINITNGQGNKLALDDVSATIDILPPGNKTELQTLVDKANAAYNGAVEGTQEGQFAVGSKAVLKSHIDEAQAALNGVGGTKAAPTSQFQSKLDAQSADVSSALHAFKAGLTGQYRINFTTLKDTSDAVSTMGNYFLKPYTLKLNNGVKKVSFTLKDSTIVPSLKVEQNGVLTETAVLSTDTTANTRVVEFEVNDLNSILNATVHISTMNQGNPYEHDYTIRLKFDSLVDAVNITALNAAISSAQTAYSNAVEGTANGQYPAGSKAALQTAIDAAKAVANDTVSTQAAVNQAAVSLQVALGTFTFSVNGAAYDLNFTIMNAEKDEPSSMDSYFLKPGKLIAQQGSYQVMATLKNSATVPSFKVEQNGVLTETTVVSTDTVNNTRVLTFPVQDLTALLNAQVHVSTTYNGAPYEKDYAIRLKFDEFAMSNKAALTNAIAQAQTEHDAAVEGSAAGQYPAGAKGALQTAIDAAKAVANNSGAEQTAVDNAVTALQTALIIFHASVIATGTNPTDPNNLADGEYTIGFTALKDGTEETSVMDGYTLKPAKLDVVDGKKYISLTLTNSDWVKFFQTQQNGVYVDAEVVSPDTSVDGVNQRVVKFEIADFTSKINAYTHVKIPDGVLPFPYDNKYYVQFKFDGSTIESVGGSTPTNPTTPLTDGNYTFGFQATSVDPSGDPISNYLDSAGKVKIENGKSLVTFKVKSGASLTKLLWIKANGETKEFLPKAVAKASGLVRVLASDAGTTDVQFELEQLSGTYIASFAVQQGNETAERAYQLTFNNITAEDPSNPGNGGNNGGSTGGNTGGGNGGGGTGGNSSSLADGKYSINYRIIKYDTDETSVMQDYVITPGVLTVEGGKQYVSFTLKQSKEITDFQVEQNGTLTDTTVISSDEAKNTRTVQFEVPDLSSRIKGWVKISWPEFNYFHDYDVHISFDKSSVKKLSDSAAAALGGGSKEATLKNGDYDIAFKVLQSRNNLESKVNDYILHPATLTIKDKEKFISLTLLHNKEITEFKVKSNNELIDADVVSTNEEENSRIVKFEVKDLSATLPAHLKWVAEDGTEEEIDFDIVFDVDSLGADPAEETPVETEPGTEEPTTPQEPSSNGLQDIQDHWAKASIERAIALGIVNGYEDGTFRPDGEVSRAEFTAMIGRALKLQNSGDELSFADKDRIPDWVKPTLAQAVEEGIISSYEDSTFRAERKITRAEIAVMIVRALKLPLDEAAELPFADASDIPDWAKAQVAAAHELGMINGRENNLFAPNESATRAEAVTLILAMLNYVQ